MYHKKETYLCGIIRLYERTVDIGGKELKTKAEKLFDIFENKLLEYYKTKTVRASQVQMAMDIAAFLDKKESRRIMLIEAPVGTGKSLGALIPSMLQSNKGKNGRVVYATATNNLQGQLMYSEVPLLKKLSLVKQPILAMGKSHYYCHRELRAKKDNFSSKERELFSNFFREAETGQRNELEDKYKQDISDSKWSKVALNASMRECERCDHSLVCPSYVHRQNFMSVNNDLIITNHDQLIRSVLNVITEPQKPSIVPIYPGIIIIDEAHDFLENFLNQLEESFTLHTIKFLKREISNKHKKRYEQLINSIEKILSDKAKSDKISSQGRYPIPVEIFPILKELNAIVNDSLIESSTREFYSTYYQNNHELEDISNMLKNIFDDKYVKWINYEDKKFSLISETFPSDFRRFMEFLSDNNKIIIMSGTLTSNGDFDSVINQWRLNSKEVITKKLDTPFDYQNQAIVYVPEHIKDPHSSKYIESVNKEIQSLISLTEGRSLILTTSKEHMISISKNLSPFLRKQNINLFVQDQGGVEKLTKQFKDDETSVLVGSGSFFSGFSVPGRSLVSVILSKLPFPVPDDPFLRLIGQGYEDEFFNMVSIPHMINKLNQAAGRLIRDINDFGIFTILDSRIFTSTKYGVKVQEELKNKGYRITRSFEEVRRFLTKKFHEGAKAKYKPYARDDIVVKDILWEIPVIKQEITTVEKKPRRSKNAITKTKIKVAKEKTVLMPKCLELGCSGECGDKIKEEIREGLVKEYGANSVKFYSSPCKKFCHVFIEPIDILEKYFTPTK